MTPEGIRQRSEILNMQVIARDTGKRIGVVKELLIDIDRQEVVALGLRDNLLSLGGMPKFMMLASIQKIGDVILVDDEDVIEDIEVDAYSSLINSEVITENGELLGKVRGFKFNQKTGELVSVIVASLGLPLIPDQAISTYELPIEELVSTGPDRLIVFEGAGDRLLQLSVGIMERLGITEPPWEQNLNEDILPPTITVDKQLPSGRPINVQEKARRQQPSRVVEEVWEESQQWVEREPEPVREMPEPIYYDEPEEENWSEVSRSDRYPKYNEEYTPARSDRQYKEYDDYEEDYDDINTDAWASPRKEAQPYEPPRVNIPEKTKTREYEEEPGSY